jgi:hypothetical protein
MWGHRVPALPCAPEKPKAQFMEERMFAWSAKPDCFPKSHSGAWFLSLSIIFSIDHELQLCLHWLWVSGLGSWTGFWWEQP